MKKIFLSLLLLLVTASTFSQRIIDKPDYGMSNIPGSITKIELNLDATIVHFHLEMPEGNSFSVPNKSFIQDTKGGEKLFVTKAEGVPLNKKYNLPESGQIDYQLYFSPLPATVNTIDFGEANQGGNWSVYDIVINEEQEQFLLPKELQGNWFLTDGSNQWDYGFYKSKAIVDMAVWDYKTVEKSKGSYAIVLESNGKQKTIYAQIDKKGTSLGNDKKQLKLYSTTKIEKPNYKLANDKMFSNIIFKTDSTTYSGVVKGYSKRANIKTGAIHVNNVLTGNQDNYVVKIAPDGSFSVKFAIDYPQSIYVRLANFNSDVYVEPGKVTFQLIDGENKLFMGDCARVNTDLKTLGRQSYEEYGKLRKAILETSPEEYKKACLTIKNKEIEKLNQTIKKQFISQKAIQIKKLDIEYGTFLEILSYEMYRESPRNRENLSDAKPKQDYKLEVSYYDFVTESVLNDQLAVIGINYSIFINRLKYAQILRSRFSAMSYNSTAEIAEKLQKSGVVLTKEELEMATESKKLDASRSKFGDFYNTNASKIRSFIQKHEEDYARLRKEKPKTGVSVSDLATSLKAQGISLSAEENELLQLHELSLLTKEEKEQEMKFTTKYGQIVQKFYEKYQTNIQEITNEKDFKKSKDKYKEVFGLNEAFVFDIFTLQNKLQELESNAIPFSDNQLKKIQSEIRHPFLSNYIVLENDRLKSKIESNKTKTGFTVNAVKKNEGDELFESLIAKFKGKVIYVDFWATWCSPCMSGIKEIAPLKEEMKNENVVFLYITNQTSPVNSWNVKIPDIKGEHYRVSEDEWNYLAQKFNISGIPHYVLVNKKGEIVNPRLGHFGNGQLKSILEKEIETF